MRRVNTRCTVAFAASYLVKLNGHQRTLDLAYRPVWSKGPCGLPELSASLPYNRTAGAVGLAVRKAVVAAVVGVVLADAAITLIFKWVRL